MPGKFSTMRRVLSVTILSLFMISAPLTHWTLVVLSMSPIGSVVKSVNLGQTYPGYMLYNPQDGYVYFADLDGIYVISGESIVGVIPVNTPFPGETLPIMYYDNSTGYVYVNLASSIGVIYGTQIIHNISLNGYIYSIVYDPQNGMIYAATASDLYAVNTVSDTISGETNISYGVTYMLVDPSNGEIYVASLDYITVLTPSLNLVSKLNVNGSVYMLLYDPSDGYIYALGGSQIYVINPTADSVIAEIKDSPNLFMSVTYPQMVYDQQDGYLYVVNGSYVGVISSTDVVAEIPTDNIVYGLAFDQGDNYVYVGGRNFTYALDPEFNSIIGNITTPGVPVFMLYSNGYIYEADVLPNYDVELYVIGTQRVQSSTAQLIINVYNYNGNTASSLGGETYALLINASTNQMVSKAYMNGNSQVIFNNITPGEYVVEVYHYPGSGLNVTEYWGNITVNVASSSVVNFFRDTPVIVNLNYTTVNNTDNITLVVYNPLSYSVEGTVYFYVSSYSVPASYQEYIHPGFNYFNLGVPTTTSYVYVVLSAYINNYYGTPITTDEAELTFNSGSQVEATNIIPYFYNSSAEGLIYVNYTKAELGVMLRGVMFGNLSIPGVFDANNQSYFTYKVAGPFIVNTTIDGWHIYGFTYVALPTYANGTVVNYSYKLQKTLIIAYNGKQIIALIYYRNLAPVPLQLNQYWSHIHKGNDGAGFGIWPSDYNPYVNSSQGLINQSYYLDGNTSVYINESYVGQLNSFGLYQVLPVGPISMVNDQEGWNVTIDIINNMSSTPQIQVVTVGLRVGQATVDYSFLDIQHAAITLFPDRSAQYVYSIGLNANPPNYEEIEGILPDLISLVNTTYVTNTTDKIVINVFNVNGKPASGVPGVVYGFLLNNEVQIIETSYMNSKSQLVFNNVPPGNYVVDIYHYPNIGLNETEYWGNVSVSVNYGQTIILNFTRDTPWIYDVNLQPLYNGSYKVNVVIDNPLDLTIDGRVLVDVYSQSGLEKSYLIGITYFLQGLNNFSLTISPQSEPSYIYVVAYSWLYQYWGEPVATDQYNYTVSPSYFYIPVCFEGNTYYVYWESPGIYGELTPSQFISIWESPRLIKFYQLTFTNGTPVTNITTEETILTYLYLWIYLQENFKNIVQYYSYQSEGYEGLEGALNPVTPYTITLANWISEVLNYILLVFSILSGLQIPSSTIKLIKDATLLSFKVFILVYTGKLSQVFGQQKASEIKTLFGQYGLTTSNFIATVEKFEELSPVQQQSFIKELYAIIYGSELPNEDAKITQIVIDSLGEKLASIFVVSFSESLYESITEVGLNRALGSAILDNFESGLADTLVDSLLSPEALAGFFLISLANIIEKAWNLPNSILYSELLSFMYLANESYSGLNTLITEFQTSSNINLTLASELYSSITLNKYIWFNIWYQIYLIEKFTYTNIIGEVFITFLGVSNPKSVQIAYEASQIDFEEVNTSLGMLVSLAESANSTISEDSRPISLGNITPPVTFSNSTYEDIKNYAIHTLIYLLLTNSYLNPLLLPTTGLLILQIASDPPLAVLNINSTKIIINGTHVLTNNPYILVSRTNNSIEVLVPAGNVTYLGFESNETLTIDVTYDNESIAPIVLQPYTAEVLKLSNLSLLEFNSSVEINESGLLEVKGANNFSFLWISNGRLPVVGLLPGEYTITNTNVTETVVVQNVTETFPQPANAGGVGGIVPANTQQPTNYIPIVILTVLVVALVIVLAMMRKRK
ncbi:YncE family protein [Stygiolobus caldivivus]|uniref:Uncharacterized protein n=1 Tax=Stygiolobus caldivivus TaxID=2824673 RepID=A0A8D5ZJ51_9CREN|nr:hypothetical protein [Stygiolobus caldivivus]BCU69990.1 hypothetical protein KN1_12870 [Stygiolobus caldivivus]